MPTEGTPQVESSTPVRSEGPRRLTDAEVSGLKESRTDVRAPRPQLPTEELIARAAAAAEEARTRELRTHLGMIHAHQKMSVRQFREAADLGTEATDVLQRYEQQGYLQSIWKTSRRWYSLTDQGVAIIS